VFIDSSPCSHLLLNPQYLPPIELNQLLLFHRLTRPQELGDTNLPRQHNQWHTCRHLTTSLHSPTMLNACDYRHRNLLKITSIQYSNTRPNSHYRQLQWQLQRLPLAKPKMNSISDNMGNRSLHLTRRLYLYLASNTHSHLSQLLYILTPNSSTEF